MPQNGWVDGESHSPRNWDEGKQPLPIPLPLPPTSIATHTLRSGRETECDGTSHYAMTSPNMTLYPADHPIAPIRNLWLDVTASQVSQSWPVGFLWVQKPDCRPKDLGHRMLCVSHLGRDVSLDPKYCGASGAME